MATTSLDFETDDIILPPPVLPKNALLERALKGRRSTRSFLADELPLETLSALLWAAFGINRPDGHGRTAPSARNWQEIDVYAMVTTGAYRYDPVAHRLRHVSAEDLRGDTGMQDFVAGAPLNLAYVADFARLPETTGEERSFFCGADAGCIAQNVYLFCAVSGLATVVRGLVDRRRLARSLGLAATQRIALAQTVGYPGPGA